MVEFALLTGSMPGCWWEFVKTLVWLHVWSFGLSAGLRWCLSWSLGRHLLCARLGPRWPVGVVGARTTSKTK